MAEYAAPLRDMKFVIRDIIDVEELMALARYDDVDDDIIDAVLEEGGKFARDVLSPLNAPGDREGAVWSDEGVKTASGFKDAYRAYVENGWNGVCGDPEFGGQGLPLFLGVALMEMVDAANMSFSLCPILSGGAIEAVAAHGTDEQKNTYLEKLTSGEWTGTMNLTEPQAGSDVGALRTKAEEAGDGSYRISGQKIFITYGDHDMADNIIHLVLARLPGAPEGTKGISLFIVPKFLINKDGSLGARNDVKCVSIEHKLGIMASPTCVMSFGDQGNCVGYLIGEENRGMSAMFTMMNNARLNIGVQGVACSERAYQMALDYAKDRVQGVAIGATEKGGIIDHADVRRMLMTIKSTTEAARAITYLNALALDMGHYHPDEEVRRNYRGLADLLTPLSKAYGTDLGVENSSLALQVHGGMGYIEETGIAQIFRDARINPIYEGTNGIQAMDLVGRKMTMGGGEHWRRLLDVMADFAAEMPQDSTAKNLARAVDVTRECAEWLFDQHKSNLRSVMAGSVPYLRLLSTTVGCYLLAKGAVSAQARLADDPDFLGAKITTARFYAEHIVSGALGLKETIMAGDELLYAINDEHM